MTFTKEYFALWGTRHFDWHRPQTALCKHCLPADIRNELAAMATAQDLETAKKQLTKSEI